MDLFINNNGREERMDHPRFIFIFGWGLSYGVYLQRFLLLYIRFGVYICFLFIYQENRHEFICEWEKDGRNAEN